MSRVLESNIARSIQTPRGLAQSFCDVLGLARILGKLSTLSIGLIYFLVISNVDAEEGQGCTQASELVQRSLASESSFEEKERSLRDASAKCPKMSEVHGALANLLHKSAKFSEAVKEYSAALDLGDRVEYRLGLISSYLALNDLTAAWQQIEIVSSNSPDNLLVLQFRSIVLERKGDIPGAISALERAVSLNGQDFLSRYNLGVLRMKSGNKAMAAADLAQACELNSNDSESCLNAGIVYSTLGNFDQAGIYLERATQRDPKNERAIGALAAVFERIGEIDKAELNLRRAIALAPQNIDLKIKLGSVLIAKGQPFLAVELLKPIVDSNLGDIRAVSTLAMAYLGIADYRNAESLLVNAISVDPNNAQNRNNLGVAQRYLNKTEDARQSFVAALTLDPNLAEAQENLAELGE